MKLNIKKLDLMQTLRTGLGDNGGGAVASVSSSGGGLSGGDVLGLAIVGLVVGGVIYMFLTPPADETEKLLSTVGTPIGDDAERAQAAMAARVRAEKEAEAAHRSRTMYSPAT